MSIDIESTDMQNDLLNNLFSVLYPDKNLPIFQRTSIRWIVKEFNLSKERLQEIYNGWKIRWTSGQTEQKYIVKNNAEPVSIFSLSLSAILSEESLSEIIEKNLQEYAKISGFPIQLVTLVFEKKSGILQHNSLFARAQIIEELLTQKTKMSPKAVSISDNAIIAGSPHKKERQIFVANQVTAEGLDEIQRLYMAYQLECHVAIDGPPGTGKTHTVIEVADLIGVPLFTKTCSQRTTESHIISYPVLTVQDGVSVTGQVNGPLVNAMIQPGIFYGDEFNLLKEDVQKRMNSAFDERRYIDRTDGLQVNAKPGFWGVISYNPTMDFSGRDLEDSVADRFIHFTFSRWPANFKAYIAHQKSTNGKATYKDFEISLSKRGIARSGRFVKELVDDGKKKWVDFFTNQKITEEVIYDYEVYLPIGANQNFDAESVEKLEKIAFNEIKFARALSLFTEILQSLRTKGKSSEMKKFGLSGVLENEDLELLSLHEGSARIEVAALKHYHFLIGNGAKRYLAQSYATRLVIDQLCYGQYKSKMMRSQTVYQLINSIAKTMGLFIDDAKFNVAIKNK